MPRGNDAAAAAADLIAKGGVTSNAETLIQANQARLTPGLMAAQVRGIDAEATAELDLVQVGKDAGLPDDHVVEAAAVRGNAVSYVATGPDGRSYKGAYYPDGKQEPTEAAADAAHRERIAAELDVSTEIANARDNAAKQLEAALAEINEATAEAIQKARDEANDRIAKAEEEAAKADEEASTGDAGDPTGPNDPRQASGAKRRTGSKKSGGSSAKKGSGSSKKS